VVGQSEYEAWLVEAKQFASLDRVDLAATTLVNP